MTTAYIGQSISRTDGRAKVTGEAKYAFEHQVPDLAYGYVVASSVARGTIRRIDATVALQVPGVLNVFTHENSPPLPPRNGAVVDDAGSPGEPFIPLQGNEVFFNHQPVALVVAETFELARCAASLVHIEYEAVEHATDLDAALERAYVPPPRGFLPPTPTPRGDAEKALAGAATTIQFECRLPAEHPNPMEPFATTVVWQGNGTLAVYDKTQGVQNVQGYLCSLFGCPAGDIRVLSPYVGGAFGAGLRPQYQAFLAVLAARALKRSIKVTLTREQMFSLHYRPFAWQRVALASAPEGRLEAIVHEAITGTSTFEDYSEQIVPWSGLLYQCDNVTLSSKVTKLDLNTPGDVRAPGACWGVYALECAMDELAVELRMDPVELRLKNYAERDQIARRPFSSKPLRECYQLGAERFGWSRRTPAPRSMREGHTLIGLGMATGAWDAFQVPATARCVVNADGTATVSSATEDIGTGTYTVMTQIAADVLGLPIERVTFKLGDSSLPQAPLEGGSFTVASVGSAVKAACEKARKAMRAGGQTVTVVASAQPSERRKDVSCYTHSAVFAEVHVDEDLGTIQVARVVSAVDAGRVINPKTARSQVMGGIVWGIGMALEEASVIDQAFGRFMNHSFGEYHVAVNADVRDIDVVFVETGDEIVNPLGAKGLGEIGVVGVAAAIANAIFHATGRRVRDLPITLDALM